MIHGSGQKCPEDKNETLSRWSDPQAVVRVGINESERGGRFWDKQNLPTKKISERQLNLNLRIVRPGSCQPIRNVFNSLWVGEFRKHFFVFFDCKEVIFRGNKARKKN